MKTRGRYFVLILALFVSFIWSPGAFAKADPKAPDMTTVDAAFTYGKKNYFFYSEWYYRYSHNSNKPDPGYPIKINKAWHGMPKAFQKDIDAVFLWDQKRVYFFKGDEYLRYNMKKDRVDKGYPKKISSEWKGLWHRDIDAAIVWPGNKKIYFFKGGEVKRYNFDKDKTEFTKKIPQSWKGVWPEGVDAALKWDGKKSYLFSQQQYIRYNNKADKAESGYPKDIESEWQFSKGEAFAPVKQKKGPNCGGINKKGCGFAPADYISKARSSCPSGSFWDPVDGGSCYKCPSNYNRTLLHSVKSNKACQRASRESLKKASRKKNTALPWACSKGQFWDAYDSGACWTCPKNYNRTAYHVASSKACAKRIGSKMAKASYKGGLPCAKGSFLDIGKGQCWSCPGGYNRTVISAVDQPKACQAQNICSSGNVAVGNPVSGYTCFKKNACGRRGQRPCLIVERVPSCNKGLLEDFVVNKCVDAEIAACLTGVRTIRYAMMGTKGLSKVEQEAKKAANLALDELKKKIPGLKKALDTSAKTFRALADKAEKIAGESFEKVLPEVVEAMEKMEPTIEKIGASFVKNEKKILKLLSSDEFCTMTSRKRGQELKHLLRVDLSKVKLTQADPGIWETVSDSLFIKPAHANVGDNAGFLLGFDILGKVEHGILGLTLAFGGDLNFKNWKVYMGNYFAASTDEITSKKPVIEPYFEFKFNSPEDWGRDFDVELSGVMNHKEARKNKKRGRFSSNASITLFSANSDGASPFNGFSIRPGLAQDTTESEENSGVLKKGSLSVGVRKIWAISDL